MFRCKWQDSLILNKKRLWSAAVTLTAISGCYPCRKQDVVLNTQFPKAFITFDFLELYGTSSTVLFSIYHDPFHLITWWLPNEQTHKTSPVPLFGSFFIFLAAEIWFEVMSLNLLIKAPTCHGTISQLAAAPSSESSPSYIHSELYETNFPNIICFNKSTGNLQIACRKSTACRKIWCLVLHSFKYRYIKIQQNII